MTNKDKLELLRRAVAASSQAAVARRIGRSAAAVNQVLKGTYAGNPQAILDLVAAYFGDETVMCPVLGEIPRHRCIEERGKPFCPTNPVRVRLYKECAKCGRNR